MARYDHLPIWKVAMDLTALVEAAVGRFPRYHKYTLGSDLRRQCYGVCRGIVVANQAGAQRARALDQLATRIEGLKLMIRLGKETRAWARFSEFERAAELAVALGRQCGGWRRSLEGGRHSPPPPRPEGAPRGVAP